MGIEWTFDLDSMNWGVEDGTWEFVRPDGSTGSIAMKVLLVEDARSGVRVRLRLPTEAPEGVEVPPEFKPPAQGIGEALLERKAPDLQVARTMPTAPPPGQNGG